GGDLGEEAFRQAADQERQAGGFGDGDLLDSGPGAAVAGELDHQEVDERLADVVEELGGGDGRFVDGEGELAAGAQRAHLGELVSRQRLLEDVDADLKKAIRDEAGVVELEALVGVGPDEGAGAGGLANGVGNGDVTLRVDGGLEVEVAVAL